MKRLLIIFALLMGSPAIAQIQAGDNYLLLMPAPDRSVSTTLADDFYKNALNYLEREASLRLIPGQDFLDYCRKSRLDKYGLSSPEQAKNAGETLGASKVISTRLRKSNNKLNFDMKLMETSSGKILAELEGDLFMKDNTVDYSVLWNNLERLMAIAETPAPSSGEVLPGTGTPKMDSYPYYEISSIPVSGPLPESYIIEGVDSLCAYGNLAFYYAYFGILPEKDLSRFEKALIQSDFLIPELRTEPRGIPISTYKEGIQILGLFGLSERGLCELLRRGLPVAIFDFNKTTAPDGSSFWGISYSLGGFSIDGTSDNILVANSLVSRYSTDEIYRFYRHGFLVTGYHDLKNPEGVTFILHLGPYTFEGRIPHIQRRRAYLLAPMKGRYGGYSIEELENILKAGESSKEKGLQNFSVPELFYFRKGEVPQF